MREFGQFLAGLAKWFVRLLLILLVPVFLIVIGAGIAGLGIAYEVQFVMVGGFIVVGVGLLVGFFMYFGDGSLDVGDTW